MCIRDSKKTLQMVVLKMMGYAPKEISHHMELPEQTVYTRPVSYTHLDVYKRQGMVPCGYPRRGFERLARPYLKPMGGYRSGVPP